MRDARRIALFPYSRMKAEARIVPRDFAARTMSEAESAADRAAFHAVMNRPAEAGALVAEAHKASTTSAGSFEVEALLLNRERKAEEARAALASAEALDSTNFFTHMWLAQLALSGTPDEAALAAAEKRLRKSVQLNDAYAPSLSILANVLAQQRRGEAAVEFATRPSAP
jgi:hypothetical protein